SPIPSLPLDPENIASTGLYYTYVKGSWNLTAQMEANKHIPAISDGGMMPGVYEVGNNLALGPTTRDLGLVGYWKFDEGSGTTANDSSGFANSGTLTNGPIWQSGSSCKKGACLSFNSANYISVTDSNSLNIQSNTFTISGWFKPNIDVTSMIDTYPILVIKRPWLVGGYAAHFDKSNGRLNVQYCSSGSCPGVSSITAFSGGFWYYYVGTFDGDKLKVYINGAIESTSGSQSAKIGSSAGVALTIGQDFEGVIDDVRVYNRALTEDEIKVIYGATQ
ncbi:MAG: LamG domain-containing protein, partial [Candidatus Colwellbacteria bacterium]